MPEVEDTRDWLFQTLHKPHKLIGVSYYLTTKDFKIFEGSNKLLYPRHDLTVISGELLPNAMARLIVRNDAGICIEWSITHNYLMTYPWFDGERLTRLNILQKNIGTSVQNGCFVIE